jgi:hypothetical protein
MTNQPSEENSDFLTKKVTFSLSEKFFPVRFSLKQQSIKSFVYYTILLENGKGF